VARVFTREQYCELVWSKPMTHLAKEFAISDVALHKICRKHGIPNPPLGGWAKKAAGKRVKQISLPEAKTGIADRITIASADLSRESSALANIRGQARILAQKLRLLVVGRKRLQDVEKHERFWGFVDRVEGSADDIEPELRAASCRVPRPSL